MIIRIVIKTLKVLVALAAVGNLIALFVFKYQTPSWLQRRQASSETAAALPAANADTSTGSASLQGIEFVIPVIPVSYSGESDMDALVMNDVYIRGADGQPLEDVRIQYRILEGESRLKKTILYTAMLSSGDILTETRTMNLTSRYTGPTISLMSALPGVDPAEADDYAALLCEEGVIITDDGFGNDAAEMVYAVFDGLSDEEPEATMTLVLENQVHDTYEMELTVGVLDYTGVVLVLTDHHITVTVGDDFEPHDYIGYAHDAEGNDITDDVKLNSRVEIDTPGEYMVSYRVQDSEGTYSPRKWLYVTVEEAPGETDDAEDTAGFDESLS